MYLLLLKLDCCLCDSYLTLLFYNMAWWFLYVCRSTFVNQFRKKIDLNFKFSFFIFGVHIFYSYSTDGNEIAYGSSYQR